MINTVDVVEELLTEIGPDLDALGVLRYAEGNWAIVYDKQTIVEISYQQERRCLALMVELGPAPADTRLDTYRFLMAYSSLTDQTGGLRIALDSPEGELLQLLDLFTEDLDRVRLEGALNRFTEAARAWRKVLQMGVVCDAGDDEPVGADAELLDPTGGAMERKAV